MKNTYCRWIIGILLLSCLGLSGCIETPVGPPVDMDEVLRESVETRDILDENGVKQGFTYLDRSFDFFMVIMGSEWDYKKTWQLVQFNYDEDSSDIMKISVSAKYGTKMNTIDSDFPYILGRLNFIIKKFFRCNSEIITYFK